MMTEKCQVKFRSHNLQGENIESSKGSTSPCIKYGLDEDKMF